MTPHYRITEKILNLVQEISEKSTQLSFEKRELHLRKENRIRSIQSSLAIENMKFKMLMKLMNRYLKWIHMKSMIFY